jgi:CspA family cold shock protein
VTYFNESKGYGFAAGDDGQDHFIHYTNISGDGFRTLRSGQRISYRPTKGEKGLEAHDVIVLTEGGRRRS